MKILLWGLIFFFTSFVVHLVIWKIHIPKRQTKILLGLFFGILILGLAILRMVAQNVSDFVIPMPKTFMEYIHIFLLFTSLALAYITTYSAIEVDSPSLVIVMSIAGAGPDGMDRCALEQKMNDDILIIPRVKDLVRDDMVYLDGNIYKLKPKGIFIARIFTMYRKLIKAGKGG